MTSARRCRFGLFEFDFRTGELRREGDVVKLSPQPARVLALLLATPGEIVLRDELRAHLWGDDTFVDFERGLNFCILQVRTALGDSSDNPRFVQTVPRKGYRFIAPVAALRPGRPPSGSRQPPSPPATSVPLERPPSRGPPSRGRPARRVAALGVGALVVLAPLDLAGWLRSRHGSTRGRRPTRIRARGAAVRQPHRRQRRRLPRRRAHRRAHRAARTRQPRTPRRDRAHVGDALSQHANKTRRRDRPRARRRSTSSKAASGARARGCASRPSWSRSSDQAQVWSDAFERPDGRQHGSADRCRRARRARAGAGAGARASTGPALPRPTANADAWDAYLRGRYWLNRGGADDVAPEPRAVRDGRAARSRRSRPAGRSSPKRVTCW